MSTGIITLSRFGVQIYFNSGMSHILLGNQLEAKYKGKTQENEKRTIQSFSGFIQLCNY